MSHIGSAENVRVEEAQTYASIRDGGPESQRPAGATWRNLSFACAGLILVAIGLWERLSYLGVRFDRDGFDEGVYWQTLRALASGHALYRPTFYSQPPISMLDVLPTYVVFGHSIWAARLGVVLLSLLGLLGAFLLGFALGGRVGAIVALLLLVASPIYLAQSQTLQAEAPSLALELLAVGLAYLWWREPEGRGSIYLAALTAVALVLSAMSKLLGLAGLIPIALLMLDRLGQVLRLPAEKRWSASTSLIVGCAAALATAGIVLLPFAGSLHQLWQGVVGYHVAARGVYAGAAVRNALAVGRGLLSPLTLAAVYGTGVAVVRRDTRAVPLLGWLAATLFILWNQTPLFSHHLVILVAPLVALATMSVTPLERGLPRTTRRWQVATIIAVLLIALLVGFGFRDSIGYLSEQGRRDAETAQGIQPRIVGDMQAYVRPDQLVITDGQFVVGLANRSTPPDLVDTALLRVETGSLTTQQLIDEASQPQVQAVLFYSGRLRTLTPFTDWVTAHYRLAADYGNGQALWVRR